MTDQNKDSAEAMQNIIPTAPPPPPEKKSSSYIPKQKSEIKQKDTSNAQKADMMDELNKKLNARKKDGSSYTSEDEPVQVPSSNEQSQEVASPQSNLPPQEISAPQMMPGSSIPVPPPPLPPEKKNLSYALKKNNEIKQKDTSKKSQEDMMDELKAKLAKRSKVESGSGNQSQDIEKKIEIGKQTKTPGGIIGSMMNSTLLNDVPQKSQALEDNEWDDDYNIPNQELRSANTNNQPQEYAPPAPATNQTQNKTTLAARYKPPTQQERNDFSPELLKTLQKRRIATAGEGEDINIEKKSIKKTESTITTQ